MFVKHLGCIKNGRQTHFCLLFLLVLIRLLGGVFRLWCTKVTPACESTVIFMLFVQQLISVKTSGELYGIVWFCWVFIVNLKQIVRSWTNWDHLAKVAGGFCWSWDAGLCPYPWDLESTRRPLKKPRCVEVLSSTEPSALSVGVKDSVPFPKWVYMSWQVSPTPFTFSVKWPVMS